MQCRDACWSKDVLNRTTNINLNKWKMVNRRKRDDGTTEIGCRFTPFLIQFSFFVGPITIIKIKNKNEKKSTYSHPQLLVLHLLCPLYSFSLLTLFIPLIFHLFLSSLVLCNPLYLSVMQNQYFVSIFVK